jgi:ferredoxin
MSSRPRLATALWHVALRSGLGARGGAGLPAASAAAARRAHCDDAGLAADAARVSVVFVETRTGRETRCEGRVGENLVHLAHAAAVDLEGACECSLACSTCHVVLEPAAYAQLEAPGEEEDDLLDLAFGLTATSRLGCQVKLAPGLAGTRVTLPAATRNFYVDGFKPKPH